MEIDPLVEVFPVDGFGVDQEGWAVRIRLAFRFRERAGFITKTAVWIIQRPLLGFSGRKIWGDSVVKCGDVSRKCIQDSDLRDDYRS